MSLDVSLYNGESQSSGSGIFIREDGSTREITRAEWDEKFPNSEPIVVESESAYVYSANITHNLGRMANAAGIYQALWSPEEIGITTAEQLIQPLTDGLALLKSDPESFRAFNPKNGWGDYEGLIQFVEGYLEACKQYPLTTISASR